MQIPTIVSFPSPITGFSLDWDMGKFGSGRGDNLFINPEKFNCIALEQLHDIF